MLGEYISLMHVITFTLLLMSMITELLIDTYEFFFSCLYY